MCLLCSKLKHLLLSSISHYSSPQKQIYQLLQISNHSLVSIIVHLLLVIYYSLFLRINVILYKLIEINKNIFKIHFLIIKNILVVPLQCLHFLPPFTFFLPSVKPPPTIHFPLRVLPTSFSLSLLSFFLFLLKFENTTTIKQIIYIHLSMYYYYYYYHIF
ncbi:hypothetical protein AAZV13_14G033000 [Glycine max]